MQPKDELSADELRTQLGAVRRQLSELTEEVARNDDKSRRIIKSNEDRKAIVYGQFRITSSLNLN